MASRTRHSVTMKTVLVQKITNGDQEKTWDFLHRSFCIYTWYTTQQLSIRATTQRTVYPNPVLLGYISQAQFSTRYNEPWNPSHLGSNPTVQPVVNYYTENTTSAPCNKLNYTKMNAFNLQCKWCRYKVRLGRWLQTNSWWASTAGAHIDSPVGWQ